jgi:predicted glycoside hydrolase/deacetylase ChbG (UPF0249 family)
MKGLFMRRCQLLGLVFAAAFFSPVLLRTGMAQDGEIRLLVRGDDMGAAQAVNEACILSARDGIVRSVEVIVPGPWFLDAVRLLKENPGLDVGIHLTLTSEWERVKWRPLTHAPSLVDANGYFRPMTAQRPDFPPDTGFVDANPKPQEVERELRAQIEAARRHLGKQVSHVSAHMGAAVATPALRAITEKLAREYGLSLDAPGRPPGRWSGNTLSAEEKERGLIELLERLRPGTWMNRRAPGPRHARDAEHRPQGLRGRRRRPRRRDPGLHERPGERGHRPPQDQADRLCRGRAMSESELEIEVGEPKRPPRASRALWYVLLGLLLPFTAVTYLAVSSGSPGDVRDRPVVTTTLATITGPFVGAIARNGQSCCLQSSLALGAVCGPVLALGLFAQVLPLPFGRGERTMRIALWTLGWLVWLSSGQVSFLHAFS